VTELQVRVVSDAEQARDTACEMLHALGHVPHAVDSTSAAIDRCRIDCPDVVIVDIENPDIDKTAFTQRLLNLRDSGSSRPCRIVHVLPFTSHEGRDSCTGAGADGFVTKPLLLTRLGSEIVRVLALQVETSVAAAGFHHTDQSFPP
jgi:two-component system capsular synthesis sensor histidine kinase RcsC